MLRPGGLLVLLRPGRLLPSFPGPGSPRTPGRLSLDGFIVICHHRSFTGWTGSLMGCELTKAEAAHLIGSLEPSPQANHTGAGDSGAGAPRHLAYALRLSVELTRRALAEGGADHDNRFRSRPE